MAHSVPCTCLLQVCAVCLNPLSVLGHYCPPFPLPCASWASSTPEHTRMRPALPRAPPARCGCVGVGGAWDHRAQGEGLRGRAQEVLSCCRGALGTQLNSSLVWAPPPMATVAGSGCLGSSPRSGGVRVVAGRGRNQECESRNVAALPPKEGGAGQQGPGGPQLPVEQSAVTSVTLWSGWGRRGLPLIPVSSYPFWPKAPARGGSPWAMRSSLSVAAQSPGQGI